MNVNKSNFNKTSLGDVAKVVTGKTPPKSNPIYFGGVVPFVTPAELDLNDPVIESKTYLSEQGAQKVNTIPKDSVMVSCIGSLGKVGISGTDLCTNQQINSLVFDPSKVWPRYGYHYCKLLKPYLEAIAPSTTLPIVNKSRFSEITIPLPPLPEQKRIAVILDKADQIRRKRRQAIKEAQELIPAIFYDMFGDPIINNKGWDSDSIGNNIEFLTSGSRGWARYYSEKGDKFLRIQNVKYNQLILDDIAFVDPPDTTEAKRTKVKQGDMLISITADLGRTAVIPSDIGNAYINQHLALIRLKGELDSYYVSQYLSSEGGRIQFDRLNRTGVKAGLNFDDIRSLIFFKPPLKLQNEFTHKANEVLLHLGLSLQCEKETEDLFNSLVLRAFTREL